MAIALSNQIEHFAHPGESAVPRESIEPLEGFDVVCLGCVSWLVIRSVAEYTMLQLAQNNRVLFVEPFVSLPTQIREAKWQKRTREKHRGVRQVAKNLWVYTPPPIALPGVSRWTWVANFNGWLLARLLRGVLRSLEFQDVLLWTYLYNTVSLTRSLPARLKIYERTDNDQAVAKSEKRRRVIGALEEKQCRAADLIFAVTDELAETIRRFHPNVQVVNCAADVEFFGRARLESTAVPDDIARLPKPVIGYMGGVDPWKMDVELLVHIARTHPEWSIALCGYVWCGFDPAVLAQRANIHVLGGKRYEDFPGYLKGMDCCVMPFPLNGITLNGDALKCYEYLAAGKAVVSTDVPAARRMSSVVRVADTAEAFVREIENALADPPDAVDRRVHAVSGHSWAHRTAQKSEMIRRSLRKKVAKRP
jgi:glycosyltransferase involved in cell wall biosynthesis